MTRPLRLEYPGAVYHITSRGNERKSIFRSDRDREYFFECLQQTVDRFHWICHGYVLMGNHYHLLIETPQPNLSRGMRQLNGVYTQGFNQAHRRVGHLFQGRFKAVVIDKEGYLLEVSRYIVLNPVRAGMVEKPEDWKWSSFRAMAGIEARPGFLALDGIRSRFGDDGDEAANRYVDFVRRGMGIGYPEEALSGQIILGSKGFVRKIEKQVNAKARMKEIPGEQRHSVRPELDEIFQRGMRNGEARESIIHRAYVGWGYNMREIGEYLGLHYSSVSLALKRHEKAT